MTKAFDPHNWQAAPVVRLLAGDEIALHAIADWPGSDSGPLLGLQPQRRQLAANLAQHLTGLPANHALVYGPRGCGKSSLVTAVLRLLVPLGLKVIQTDARQLQAGFDWLLAQAETGQRFLLFLDDFGFETAGSDDYRALKSCLEGALHSLPDPFILCATANRRHLVPEPAPETAVTEMHQWEADQERLSLVDRFGLWVRVPTPEPEAWLAMVDSWIGHFADRVSAASGAPLEGLPTTGEDAGLAQDALAWARGRGHRSGRVARQFAAHLVGAHGLGSGGKQPQGDGWQELLQIISDDA